jgi:hypothetical protein
MPSFPANSPPVKDAGMTGVRVDMSSEAVDRRISVAPMMDWTDDH